MSRAVDLALAMTLPDGRSLRKASSADPWIERDILTPLLDQRASYYWFEASRGCAI